MDKIIQRFCLELKSTGNKSRLDTEAILVECMLSQRKDGSLGDGFVSFIDYIRLRLRSSFRRTAVVLKSPAQLLLNVKDISNDLIDQGPNTNANMTERLFHVVKLLGESVPATLWKSIIDCLVLKTYGCPSDQHLIRVWNNLASAIANSSEATIPARGLARQYRNMELAQETKSIADQMKEVLKSRSDNHLEFSLVRTLSKAVLNGMFPDSSLEIIFAGLSESCSQKSTHIRQIDLVESRSWLFALYDWILNWTIQSNTREQTVQDVAWVYRIAVEFCYNIVSFKLPDKDLEQDLYKLQLGVVDVLSKILLATAPFYSGSPTSQFAIKLKRLGRSSTRLHTGATIEEIEDDHVVETSEDGDMTPEDLFLSVLYDVLEAITVPVYDCDESRIGAALCLVNVFIMSLQGMAPSRISEGSANESRDSSDTKKLIPSTFMDLLAPTVSACVISYLHNMETLDTNSYTLLIQGFIQILYTGTSITGTGDGQALSKTTRKWIMDVIVAGIICTDTTIAVASLKLLATAAGSKMITPELLTEANLVTIRKGLEQLRQRNELKLDTSTSVSTLLDNMWQMVA
ncbi:hypothetical protein BGX27_006530 [Mortierella sp. AM989]|nr:hypothetical protein BGX27_006530 [Mortierella sp. AM989]